MTFVQFLQAHYVALTVAAWFVFTSAVNALPAAGSPFVAGTWFMAFLRELAQQAPAKFPVLSAREQQAVDQVKASEATKAAYPEVPHA